MGHTPGLTLFSYTLDVPQTWNSKGEQQAGSLQVLRGSQDLWGQRASRRGAMRRRRGCSPGPQEEDVEGVG